MRTAPQACITPASFSAGTEALPSIDLRSESEHDLSTSAIPRVCSDGAVPVDARAI